MKFSVKSVVAGAAALALAGGMMVAGAGAAQAASFDPDASQIGTLSFYDATGAQIGGGNLSDAPMAAYYKASGPKAQTFPFNKGYVAFFTPVQGQLPAAWQTGTQSTTNQDFAVLQSSYPAGLNDPNANVVIKGNASDFTLANQVASFPSSSALDPGVYQVRIYTSADASTYFAASITVSGSTWTQTYPALPAAASTTTTLTATPASPQVVGTAVTLSASVAASPLPSNGTVKFFDGATEIGSVAYTGTNPVTLPQPALTVGSHSFTAQYVPSGISYTGSTSSAVPFTVNPVQIATTTSVAVNTGTGNAYAPVTVTATVAPLAAVGTVTFTDSVVGNLGSVAKAAGVAAPDFVTSALGAGAHTVTATFTPADAIEFSSSNGSSSAFTLAAVGATPDEQTIDVVVAPGTLTITTPYTPSNVFHMGTMALDPTATYLQATAAFPAAGDPAITITDTRAGNANWTASVSAIDFTSGVNTIDAHGLGFTAVAPTYLLNNALCSVAYDGAPIVAGECQDGAPVKPVVTNDVPSYAPTNALYPTTGLKGAPHQFATTTNGGVGTVYVNGFLNLYAPTSTQAGTYTTTVTFTAV